MDRFRNGFLAALCKLAILLAPEYSLCRYWQAQRPLLPLCTQDQFDMVDMSALMNGTGPYKKILLAEIWDFDRNLREIKRKYIEKFN